MSPVCVFVSAGGVGLCTQHRGSWDILYRLLRVSIHFFLFSGKTSVLLQTHIKHNKLLKMYIVHVFLSVLSHLCKQQALKCLKNLHHHTPTKVFRSTHMHGCTHAHTHTYIGGFFNGRPVSFHGNRGRKISFCL